MNAKKTGLIFILVFVFSVIGVCGIAAAVTPPAMVLSKSTLSFGNQIISTVSATQSVAITNTGGAALTINSITLGGSNPGQFTKTTTCGATLASGATCTVRVRFKPTSAYAKSALLNINVASPAISGSVTLTGSGTGSVLAITPLTVAFGDRLISTISGTRAIAVKNSGNAKMTINGTSLTGADPNQFTKTTTCDATLASGATCTIFVKFKPTSTDAKSATLNVNVALPAVSKTVTLTGAGTAPVLAVSPLSVEFENRLITTSSTTQVITVENFGSASLTINGIVLGGANPGQFSKTATCGANLAAGATCRVNVKFKPTSAGTKSATIKINVAAPALSQTITLTGTGVNAIAAPSAPTGVVAFAGVGLAGITWDAVDDATSYNLYWSKSPGVTTVNGTKIANIKMNFYKHKNLTLGSTYYYIVTAVNPIGESDPSSEASSHIPRLKKASVSNTAGMVMQYITYTYDENGRMIQVTTYGATGVISNYMVYEYDTESRPIRMSTYNFMDQLTQYTTIEYNADGKVVKTSLYGPMDFLMSYTTTQYNDAGKPSRITVYGSTGVISTYTSFEYTYAYNAEGDVVRTNNYDFADQLTGYTTTEYNTEGKKVTVTSYGPTGLLSKQTTYEYNSAGKAVTVSNYNLTGLTDYATTEYDADGNAIMTKNSDFADILTGYTTMEYNGVGLPVNISSYGPTGLLKASMTYEYE